MSGYEKFDTPDDDEAKKDCCSACLGPYDPRKDPVEFLSLLSLISLSIGIFLTMIGYLIPRNYEFDPDMEAEKMEEIEIYYDNLAWDLDVCIIFGMGFVVTGGLILAGIIAYLHVTSDFWATLCGDHLHDQPETDQVDSTSRTKLNPKEATAPPAPGYQSTSMSGMLPETRGAVPSSGS